MIVTSDTPGAAFVEVFDAAGPVPLVFQFDTETRIFIATMVDSEGNPKVTDFGDVLFYEGRYIYLKWSGDGPKPEWMRC